MAKAQRTDLIQHPLSCMAERRMAQVMAQGDGLCQVIIEQKGLRHSAGKL